MAAVDLPGLSDTELLERLRDLRLQIALLAPDIETREDRRRRTTKIVRGTILAAGGFIGATIDPMGLMLVLLGGWDWVEGISDDANEMNKNLALHKRVVELNNELGEIDVELRRRNLVLSS
jgi:hypothetical protein